MRSNYYINSCVAPAMTKPKVNFPEDLVKAPRVKAVTNNAIGTIFEINRKKLTEVASLNAKVLCFE